MNYLYAVLSAAGFGFFVALTIGFGMRATGDGPYGALLIVPLVVFVSMPVLVMTAQLLFFPR